MPRPRRVIEHANSRGKVYEALIGKGPLSRVALVSLTGLCLPTVSSSVDSLIDVGLVKEVGYGKSSGGRKPLLVQVVPDARFVIAVNLGEPTLRCALVNLAGQITEVIEGCKISPAIRECIIDEIRACVYRLKGFSLYRDRILGLGIATPGVTDPDTGKIHLAPILGESDLSLGKLLQDSLGLPVFVENEANVAALGEMTFGNTMGADPFVFVSMGTGIGAGIIVGNEILRGYRSAAGEIGYLIVDRQWTSKIRYGFGCFESLASETAIVQRTMRRILDGYPSLIANGKATTELNFDDVVQAIKGKDSLAQQILSEVVEYFAIGLANIIAVLDPKLIILGGGISKVGNDILIPLREHLSKLVPYEPIVNISQFGDNANLIGSAALVIRSTSI